MRQNPTLDIKITEKTLHYCLLIRTINIYKVGALNNLGNAASAAQSLSRNSVLSIMRG